MTKATTTISPDEAIDQMSTQAITCRDYSHAWAPWYVTKFTGAGGFERGVRCGVCGTARIETLDRLGRLDGRRYEYPDGYLVKGSGRIDADFRAKIRLTSMLRAPQLETKRKPRQKKKAAA